jgi:hypothetical protein
VLSTLTKPSRIRDAQKQLQKDLLEQLPALGRQWVTFRPTSVEMKIYGNPDRLYFGPRVIRDEGKFWNAFGIFDPKRSKQEITVEINLSAEGGRTAGFVAEDGDGRRFLMHTGGIGGGKKGVSREAFMAWLNPELIAVQDNRQVEAGILIAQLGSSDLSQRVESFVRSVRGFKDAVKGGLLQRPAFASGVEKWREYRKEFSGRKTGSVEADLDYVSYHGDVVHALREWTERRANGVVTNSPLIDLLVHDDKDNLMEVYEVKSSTNRQVLYAGIGQLIVHGSNARVSRTLVLPAAEEIPADVTAGLEGSQIRVLRYKIAKTGLVSIIEN